jgi:RNA polymerase sigma-70 factor, ECF subfamily
LNKQNKEEGMAEADWSDEELALAFQQGNEAAFDALARRHQGRMYAVAYRITGNREDALDVAQDALVKAYRKIHSWQPSGGFAAWLLKLTSNQAIDAIRRRKRRAMSHMDDQFIETRLADHSPSGNTETVVRAGEIEARIQQSLGVLSVTQRTVFVLRHYEGYQLAGIADVLGCTVGSVKVHLFRAVRKLQKELGDLYEDVKEPD